ncbi:3' exonuclease, exosome component [Theileria orientalis]|uniref:3' exonuclease, exosome component n=1 Tax=Theileria orientalis TaxID=68886 RepID=A0A976SIL7_THEOR|nr:3' exonuclease, exosome component [Theileria orientalis]
MADSIDEDTQMTDRFNQLRPLDVKLSTSSTFHGSCIINLGNTIVKCLVNLPKVSAKKASSDYGQFTVELTSNDSFHTQKDLETLKTHILETFEKHIIIDDYPCQIIEAYIIVANDDGGLLPTVLMGMCLALIDCGIHLYDVIAACSVCVFKDNNQQLTVALDLTREEEEYYRSLDPNLTVVNLGYCSQLKTIALLYSKGYYIGESLKQALEVAKEACSLLSGELFNVLKSNHIWKAESSNFVLQTEYIQPSVDANSIM